MRGRRPHVRRSTIALVAAFIGLTALYLQIRDEGESETPIIGILTETTTTTTEVP